MSIGRTMFLFLSLALTVVALPERAFSASVDDSLNPGASSVVLSIALQPDGKILIGGVFTTMGGVTRNHMARLNGNGSFDLVRVFHMRKNHMDEEIT